MVQVKGQNKKKAKTLWAHENCATWSVGVYLSKDGKRLLGIPTALATASVAQCAHCNRQGATGMEALRALGEGGQIIQHWGVTFGAFPILLYLCVLWVAPPSTLG